jgi:hypothetical protein
MTFGATPNRHSNVSMSFRLTGTSSTQDEGHERPRTTAVFVLLLVQAGGAPEFPQSGLRASGEQSQSWAGTPAAAMNDSETKWCGFGSHGAARSCTVQGEPARSAIDQPSKSPHLPRWRGGRVVEGAPLLRENTSSKSPSESGQVVRPRCFAAKPASPTMSTYGTPRKLRYSGPSYDLTVLQCRHYVPFTGHATGTVCRR